MIVKLTRSAVGAGIGGQVTANLGDSNRLAKHMVSWEIIPIGTTKVSAAKIMLQGSYDGQGVPSGLATPVAGDGAIINPALVVGSTAERIAHGLFYYLLNGENYSKAADAAGVVFSAAHKVAANKFGAIGVYINAAGAIYTWIDSAAQTDTLSHDTALLALAEVQAGDFPHPIDTIQIGYILIASDGTLWTANTDDLTNGSDVTTATFFSTTSSYHEIYEYELVAGDITLQKGTWHYANTRPNNWVRIFLSEITGDGQFEIIDTILT